MPTNQQPRPEVEPVVRRGMPFSCGGCTQGFNTFLTALKLPCRKAGSWVLNPFSTNKKDDDTRRLLRNGYQLKGYITRVINGNPVQIPVSRLDIIPPKGGTAAVRPKQN